MGMFSEHIKRLPRKKKKILKSNCRLYGQKIIKYVRMVHKPCERMVIEIEAIPVS